MRLALAIVTLVASLAEAQAPCAGALCLGSGRVPVRVRGSLDVIGSMGASSVDAGTVLEDGRPVISATSASNTYYVDASTGIDNTTCGAVDSPCLTVQRAINRIPKNMRHGAKVKLAAGSFGSFMVSGFMPDYGAQTANAGLLIEGTLANVTPTTGSATGTATAVSTGSTVTFGTLTDSGQSWTSDDLVGHFLVITGGTGVGWVKPIIANTSTTITIAGTWGSPVPVVGSTYAIQDSASLITSCGTQPPAPGSSVSTTTAATRLAGNAMGMSVEIKWLKYTAACPFAVYQGSDGATMVLLADQFDTTTGTSSKIAYGGAFFVQDIASKYSSTTGTHFNVGGAPSFSASAAGTVANPTGWLVGFGTIQNSLFINGNTGLNLQSVRGNLLGLALQNIDSAGIRVITSQNFQGIQISCTNTASAIGVAMDHSVTFGLAGTQVAPDHVNISGCATAFLADGPSSFLTSINATTVTGATYGLKVNDGALVTLSAGNTWTTATADILVDGTTTSSVAAVTSGTCVTGIAGFGSRVCKP